ncbi:MAG: hypothetical protein DA408_07270 [Bacteroidetes bacterium]|nr:MAG: hypothetical protein C7N36_13400 [Bacteroidota bacterium]PTM13299.1 MAG: hypothetical protein DA408_07270 [Bacteroidota bacterium]
MRILLVLLGISIAAFACQPRPAVEADSPVAAAADTAAVANQLAVAAGDSLPLTAATVAYAQSRSADFPAGEWVEFTPAVLGDLCSNKYGCLQDKLYPLGWSEDGRFAYLIERANEAVTNFTLHLIIQNTNTDQLVVEKIFKASDQKGYTEDNDQWTVSSVWKANRSAYQQLLDEHGIHLGNGTQFYPLPYQVGETTYRFSSANEKVMNDYSGKEVVSKHRLVAQAAGQGQGQRQKNILTHTFGKYDLALATRALGVFKSPYENRVAVVDAWEKRGYEGPPNVLKLLVVGCILEDGFK